MKYIFYNQDRLLNESFRTSKTLTFIGNSIPFYEKPKVFSLLEMGQQYLFVHSSPNLTKDIVENYKFELDKTKNFTILVNRISRVYLTWPHGNCSNDGKTNLNSNLHTHFIYKV